MKIDNIMIKPRLIGAFILVAAIGAIIGITGIRNINRIDKADTMLYQQVTVPTGELAIIARDFHRSRVNMRESIMANNRQDAMNFAQRSKDQYASIDKESEKYKASLVTDEGKRLYEDFDKNFQEYKRLASKVFDFALEGKDKEATELMQGDAGTASRATQDAIDKMVESKLALGQKIAEENTALASKSSTMMITAILIGFALAMGLGIFISLSVVRPINATTNMLKDIAQGEGDLTQRLEASGRDEIAQLCNWFNTFVDKIHDIIVDLAGSAETVSASSQQLNATAMEAGKATEQIAQSADRVAKGSSEQAAKAEFQQKELQQMAGSLEDLNQGAQEQARVVERTASAVKDITDNVAMVSEGAETAAKQAVDARTQAEDGAKSVERSTAAMANIKEQANAVAGSISELGDASQQIGAIVEAINDIAEQTNLLALNAAIEAARAGEHGKGFAVVADEVRKLAERSSKETKEIADRISRIQDLTQQAVVATEAATNGVEEGAQLAQEAASALSKIIGGADSVVQQAESVSAAAETMNAAIAEVLKAVESVSALTEETAAAVQTMRDSNELIVRNAEAVTALTQENSAAAQEASAATEEQTASMQELAASSEQLARVAAEVQALVSQFKTNANKTEKAGKASHLTAVSGGETRRKAA